MAEKTITLRVANRAILIWWMLVLVGLLTFLLPGLWVMLWVHTLGLPGLVYADFQLIRLTGGGVGGIALLRALYLKFSASYTVSRDAVSARQGVFARKIDYVRSHHIRSINVQQGLLGRMLGYGDIGFASAGSGRVEVLFQRVANPLALKELIAKSLFSSGRNQYDPGDDGLGGNRSDRQPREGADRKRGSASLARQVKVTRSTKLR